MVDSGISIAVTTKGGLPTSARSLILMKVGSLYRTLLCNNRVQDWPREICPNDHKYNSVVDVSSFSFALLMLCVFPFHGHKMGMNRKRK